MKVKELYFLFRDYFKLRKWDVMKNENSPEIVRLIEVTKKFIEFAEKLLDTGKITQEQYTAMTQNKIRFLNDMERKSISK